MLSVSIGTRFHITCLKYRIDQFSLWFWNSVSLKSYQQNLICKSHFSVLTLPFFTFIFTFKILVANISIVLWRMVTKLWLWSGFWNESDLSLRNILKDILSTISTSLFNFFPSSIYPNSNYWKTKNSAVKPLWLIQIM